MREEVGDLVDVREAVRVRVSDDVSVDEGVTAIVRVLEGVMTDATGGRATPRSREPSGAVYTTLASKERESTRTTESSTQAYTANAA